MPSTLIHHPIESELDVLILAADGSFVCAESVYLSDPALILTIPVQVASKFTIPVQVFDTLTNPVQVFDTITIPVTIQ